MSKEILDVYQMTGESREGHKYQVELACVPGKQEESFKKHIEKIGWDHYGYKLIECKKPKVTHIKVELEEK